MGRYLDIIEAESTNRQYDKSDQNDKSPLKPVPEDETACNFTTKGSREVIPRIPEGPIPWHDATPDERAEIKGALFEGQPVQIYSKVLGEIVWWALDDDTTFSLSDPSNVK
jgi:hypothetical protein